MDPKAKTAEKYVFMLNIADIQLRIHTLAHAFKRTMCTHTHPGIHTQIQTHIEHQSLWGPCDCCLWHISKHQTSNLTEPEIGAL